ncbi:MAG: mechanosensitive ion channel family protein [Verrucomicrobiota bacterium]
MNFLFLAQEAAATAAEATAGETSAAPADIVTETPLKEATAVIEKAEVGFLGKEFYGNSIVDWLTALVIIAAAVMLGKVVYWVFQRVVRRFTAKTQTKIDDIIIDLIEEPIAFGLIVAGVWVGLATLSLPDWFHEKLGHVAQVLIVLAIAWMLARLTDALFREFFRPLAEKSETDLDDQLLPIAQRSVKTIIWILAVVIALNNAGYDVAALLAGLGIGGLALAMAAQDSVKNVFGGFTIFTDRPFTVNDRIQVGGYDGSVREIGIRSTRLRTLDGRQVTIPNSHFSDAPVVNVSSEPSRKVVTNLGLTYDMSPEQMETAMETLRAIAEGNDDLEEGPAIGFNGFGDFAMNIIFVYYIKSGSDILGTQTAINLEILKQFNEKGLEMAFPTQTILAQVQDS